MYINLLQQTANITSWVLLYKKKKVIHFSLNVYTYRIFVGYNYKKKHQVKVWYTINRNITYMYKLYNKLYTITVFYMMMGQDYINWFLWTIMTVYIASIIVITTVAIMIMRSNR